MMVISTPPELKLALLRQYRCTFQNMCFIQSFTIFSAATTDQYQSGSVPLYLRSMIDLLL